MRESFEAWHVISQRGLRGGRASPHRSAAPALGLAVAGGTSLGMWIALGIALRWVAHVVF